MDDFGLRKPIYKELATYGHFGREDLNVPWGKLYKTEELLDLIKVDAVDRKQ